MIRLATKQEIVYLNNITDYSISENAFEKCFVYIFHNNILGFIDFSDIYNRLELNYIWINSSCRGKGYAKKLMNFMIDYSISNEKDNITLEVSVNNMIARNLYRKFYFSEVAIRKQYYDGVDGILMIREFDDYE